MQTNRNAKSASPFRSQVLTVMIASALISASAHSQERGTLDDAKAMVQKAKAYIEENGNEKAYAAISDPNGPFVKGDTHVYVFDKTGKLLAHGRKPSMIGKNMFDMIRGQLKVAQKGGGTVTYPEMKVTAYVEMAGDVMVGSSAYAAK